MTHYERISSHAAIWPCRWGRFRNRSIVLGHLVGMFCCFLHPLKAALHLDCMSDWPLVELPAKISFPSYPFVTEECGWRIEVSRGSPAGKKLPCSLVVKGWVLLYLLPDGSGVNRLWLGRTSHLTNVTDVEESKEETALLMQHNQRSNLFLLHSFYIYYPHKSVNTLLSDSPPQISNSYSSVQTGHGVRWHRLRICSSKNDIYMTLYLIFECMH